MGKRKRQCRSCRNFNAWYIKNLHDFCAEKGICRLDGQIKRFNNQCDQFKICVDCAPCTVADLDRALQDAQTLIKLFDK